MNALTTWLSSAKKAVVAAIGVALTILTDAQVFDGFLPSSASHWIAAGIAILTPIVTYLVPNGSTTPPAAS